MNETVYEPIDPKIARNQYGALFRKTGASDADKQSALANLVTAKIDKSIRDAFHAHSVSLEPAQVAHVVGLLLMQCGTNDGLAVDRIERMTREAAYVTPSLTAEDRQRIAAALLTDGERA